MSTPTFAELRLLPALQDSLASAGFVTPTPIQALCIPILLDSHDLIGQSQTGSGKTLAYGLPLLNRLRLDHHEMHVRPWLQALVLCPTRELATQVTTELRKAGRGLPGMRILEVCGGQSGWAQRQALEQGVHVVVGTPGRVLEMFDREAMLPDEIHTVVLDEADRMLDLGFQDQVERILAGLPLERQMAFFSATFPPSISAMSERWQHEPQRVVIEGEPLEIRHVAHVAPDRVEALLTLLAHHKPGSAIVFGNFKETVKNVTAALERSGVSAGELHGDLEQIDRDRIMARLRNGSVRVLVATDVAARGIDVVGLDLVVNVEMPTKPDAYVHRTGRTGRAGRPGLAITLISERERTRLDWIAESIGAAIPVEPLPEVAGLAQHTAAMRTIFIAGGRKDKLRPGDILGALTGTPEVGGAGFAGADIGKIEIHDRFAYVAVAERIADQAFAALVNGKIKGRRFRIEAV